MNDRITLAQLRRWLLLYADRIDQQAAHLTELDAAIGDADHGLNMQRGMEKVRLRVEQSAEDSNTVGAFLRAVAMTLISSVGGAAGPLYGAFFLRAAKEADEQQSVTLAELAHMFRSGLDGVQQRGKAAPDDKTMVDTLAPAVEALEAAAAAGSSPAEALEAARAAAETGMRHTVDLQAARGRASYLGARSVGHQDPGATSAYHLIETAAVALAAEE